MIHKILLVDRNATKLRIHNAVRSYDFFLYFSSAFDQLHESYFCLSFGYRESHFMLMEREGRWGNLKNNAIPFFDFIFMFLFG